MHMDKRDAERIKGDAVAVRVVSAAITIIIVTIISAAMVYYGHKLLHWIG